jgi:hypothetical protein
MLTAADRIIKSIWRIFSKTNQTAKNAKVTFNLIAS